MFFYWFIFYNFSNSSSIIFFIKSISVKNKFKPFNFKDNIYSKSSIISLSIDDEIFMNLPSIVCLLWMYFSNVGKAFCIKITCSRPAIFLISIVLQEPYFFSFFSIIDLYLSILLLKGINHKILSSLIARYDGLECPVHFLDLSLNLYS